MADLIRMVESQQQLIDSLRRPDQQLPVTVCTPSCVSTTAITTSVRPKLLEFLTVNDKSLIRDYISPYLRACAVIGPGKAVAARFVMEQPDRIRQWMRSLQVKAPSMSCCLVAGIH